MASVEYKKVEDFGRALLTARDLDPVYELLYQSTLSGPALKKWLLAYWLFYHVGVASWIVEQDDFYESALYAFDNKFPRGAERRHFRGDGPRKAIDGLKAMYPKPEVVADDVYAPTYPACHQKVKQLPMFGDWIAFKVADMLERCLGLPIEFSTAIIFYEQPSAAAAFVYADEGYGKDWALRRDGVIAGKLEHKIELVTKRLLDVFQNEKAPPSFDRAIGVQEIETILCKYKSHRNGTYPVGKDRKEVFHALDGWGTLAAELKQGII